MNYTQLAWCLRCDEGVRITSRRTTSSPALVTLVSSSPLILVRNYWTVTTEKLDSRTVSFLLSSMRGGEVTPSLPRTHPVNDHIWDRIRFQEAESLAEAEIAGPVKPFNDDGLNIVELIL